MLCMNGYFLFLRRQAATGTSSLLSNENLSGTNTNRFDDGKYNKYS
jgi:hypothetical protein